MEISEVRVKIVGNKDDRLKAFCSACSSVPNRCQFDFSSLPSGLYSVHCQAVPLLLGQEAQAEAVSSSHLLLFPPTGERL